MSPSLKKDATHDQLYIYRARTETCKKTDDIINFQHGFCNYKQSHAINKASEYLLSKNSRVQSIGRVIIRLLKH